MTTTQILPELTEGLKKLKLSGMLEYLDSRNLEAVNNQMSYSEHLTLLVQDELLTREQRHYERSYRKAKFKGQKPLNLLIFYSIQT